MVDDTQKWGRKTARERYGSLPEPNMKAKDMSEPQFPEDKRGPDWEDDTPNNWLRGGPNESAEGKPSFDKSSGTEGHGGQDGGAPK